MPAVNAGVMFNRREPKDKKMPKEIFPPYVAFYTECIRFHVEAAIDSVGPVASFCQMTIESEGKYEIHGDTQLTLLNHLQNIFVHAAAMSRYFWPSRPGKENLHKDRSAHLRKLFKVDSSSPLKSRTLRNKLEHFDENLDVYLNKEPLVGYIIPSYVGGSVSKKGVPSHMFRAYYIDTGEFEVLGTRFEVQPIVNEIYRIYRELNQSET